MWLRFLIVGMVLSGVLLVTQHSQSNAAYENQIAACERGNEIRREERVRGIVLREFLHSAAEARGGSARAEKGAESMRDAATAQRYLQLAARLKLPVKLDCRKVIPKPGWF